MNTWLKNYWDNNPANLKITWSYLGLAIGILVGVATLEVGWSGFKAGLVASIIFLLGCVPFVAEQRIHLRLVRVLLFPILVLFIALITTALIYVIDPRHGM